MRKPMTTQYRQITPNWHMIKTPGAVFFGYTKLQVFEKADAHRRANIITDSIRLNVRPLLMRQRLAARGAL